MDVDAIINTDACAVGIGTIVRWKQLFPIRLIFYVSPKVGGAKVMGLSLARARNIGLNLQFLESDVLPVMQPFNNGFFGYSEFSCLRLDLYIVCCLSFQVLHLIMYFMKLISNIWFN